MSISEDIQDIVQMYVYIASFTVLNFPTNILYISSCFIRFTSQIFIATLAGQKIHPNLAALFFGFSCKQNYLIHTLMTNNSINHIHSTSLAKCPVDIYLENLGPQ